MSRTSRPPARARLGAALLVVPALAAGALVATVSPAAAAPTAPPATAGRGGNVYANLWEWNYRSIGAECTTVLGPAGYAGVQVAPPADSLKRTYTDAEAPLLHPWWEVYQPVSYNLTSRMGNETEFRDMVSTCRRAGVKVIVDAVVNHMTGQGTVSYGGVRYTHVRYPGLYGPNDFHTRPDDCDSASGGIEDFNDVKQVTQCELLGLADLDTGSLRVRNILAGYLNKLLSYGVTGFRVDAAKHIGVPDLQAIQKLLTNTVDGNRPYFALEVFPGGPGVLSQRYFQNAGDVLGFDYAYQVKNAFKSYTADGVGNITGLEVFGEQSGLVPGDQSLVFIENHDTERGTETLSYKDGRTNLVANMFMLAHPYGTPQVYSSFAWTNTYDSPPAKANGLITDTDCSSTAWVCVDRDAGVTAMVGFANRTGNAPVRSWWDDGQNTIAFSRGTSGFFAANNSQTATTATIPTSLPAGTYCDIVHGGKTGTSCNGPRIVVDSNGLARVTVQPKDAIAFTTAARVR